MTLQQQSRMRWLNGLPGQTSNAIRLSAARDPRLIPHARSEQSLPQTEGPRLDRDALSSARASGQRRSGSHQRAKLADAPSHSREPRSKYDAK